MKNTINHISMEGTSPRLFSYDQLSKISDDNYGVLNRCMDMSKIHADDTLVLYPVMIHFHAFGEEVAPHIRTIVTKFNETEELACQDVTFKQWDQGMELN